MRVIPASELIINADGSVFHLHLKPGHNWYRKDCVGWRSGEGISGAQEILDLSNWLLDRSELKYEKRLTAHRGDGIKPVLYSFGNEFDEARWLVKDLQQRYHKGNPWHHHMLLLRSAFSGRQLESALIEANIPYVFIGGTKLLEAAHVKDLISMLRVSVNYLDELAWIRFLTLWDGIGDAGAGKLVNEFLTQPDLTACIDILDKKQSTQTCH